MPSAPTVHSSFAAVKKRRSGAPRVATRSPGETEVGTTGGAGAGVLGPTVAVVGATVGGRSFAKRRDSSSPLLPQALRKVTTPQRSNVSATRELRATSVPLRFTRIPSPAAAMARHAGVQQSGHSHLARTRQTLCKTLKMA